LLTSIGKKIVEKRVPRGVLPLIAEKPFSSHHVRELELTVSLGNKDFL
jgi:hypothetical protein